MKKIISLLLFLFIAVEIYLCYLAIVHIGFVETVLMLIILSMFGTSLYKLTAKGQNPTLLFLTTKGYTKSKLLAAILLMIPGFLTGVLGLLLLIPGVLTVFASIFGKIFGKLFGKSLNPFGAQMNPFDMNGMQSPFGDMADLQKMFEQMQQGGMGKQSATSDYFENKSSKKSAFDFDENDTSIIDLEESKDGFKPK